MVAANNLRRCELAAQPPSVFDSVRPSTQPSRRRRLARRGGTGREGARSELTSGAATGPGGAAPCTGSPHDQRTVWVPDHRIEAHPTSVFRNSCVAATFGSNFSWVGSSYTTVPGAVVGSITGTSSRALLNMVFVDHAVWPSLLNSQLMNSLAAFGCGARLTRHHVAAGIDRTRDFWIFDVIGQALAPEVLDHQLIEPKAERRGTANDRFDGLAAVANHLRLLIDKKAPDPVFAFLFSNDRERRVDIALGHVAGDDLALPARIEQVVQGLDVVFLGQVRVDEQRAVHVGQMTEDVRLR